MASVDSCEQVLRLARTHITDSVALLGMSVGVRVPWMTAIAPGAATGSARSYTRGEEKFSGASRRSLHSRAARRSRRLGASLPRS